MPPDPSGEYATPRGSALCRWFLRSARPLPWRHRPTPYRIWVSEVILQQTRVGSAISHYRRFVRRFPSLASLARAPLSEVLKAWQGMGYYSRARNLHQTARRIHQRSAGRLPRSVAELETLPGVGPYIARAIAAQAHGEPVVALEANGLRVAARWIGERGPIDSSKVRARLTEVLAGDLAHQSPGIFHEAVMELGETLCTPLAPACSACPVASYCAVALQGIDPTTIPQRRRHSRPLHHRGSIVALYRRGRYLFQRRPPKGLLGGLWEFPGGHRRMGERPEETARRELREETGLVCGPLTYVGRIRHAYSHFSVELDLFEGAPIPEEALTPRGRRWLTLDDARRLPLPKATEKALDLLEGRASRDSGSRPGRGSS